MAEGAPTLPAATLDDDRPVAMVISPFATAPADAGQRKRALQTTALLKSAGYRVVFVFVAFEGGWRWRWNQASVDAMRAQWDEVYVYPGCTRIGMPPQEPPHHTLDEWWEESFGQWLSAMIQVRHFEVVVAHNVWLSKALTLFPPATVTVLDSHDVFHRRSDLSDIAAQEFFLPLAKDEFFGINRADIVLAIQESETELMLRHADSTVRYLPYNIETSSAENGAPAAPDYLCKDRVRFGFIGNNSHFNASGLKSLLDALSRRLAMDPAPVELVLAGQVCNLLPEDSFHAVRLGYVDDEEDFFAACDIVISPIFTGTGMKVKSADALARRKPSLFSRHAAEGLPIPAPFVSATPDAMAAAMCEISHKRPALQRMAASMGGAYRMHRRNTAKRSTAVLDAIRHKRMGIEIDLSQAAEPDVFLSAAMLALCNTRWLHSLAQVDIIAPDLAPLKLDLMLPQGCRIRTGPRREEGPSPKRRVTLAPDEEGTLTGDIDGRRIEIADLTQSLGWDPVIRDLIKAHGSAEERHPGQGAFLATGNLRRLRGPDACRGGVVLILHEAEPVQELSAAEALNAIFEHRVEGVFRNSERQPVGIERHIFTVAGLCGIPTTDSILGPVPEGRILSDMRERQNRSFRIWVALLSGDYGHRSPLTHVDL